ncbi:hypothetical protein CHARACLAT_028851 [Characodon lateralis]|uniref:Uncharacterized protein n=1 Tax=Characodon lateralis TaxID=208331 RepID=A0ABU7E7G0_9TELE|nr:hypothetical protein [Characodon lateralis]
MSPLMPLKCLNRFSKVLLKQDFVVKIQDGSLGALLLFSARFCDDFCHHSVVSFSRQELLNISLSLGIFFYHHSLTETAEREESRRACVALTAGSTLTLAFKPSSKCAFPGQQDGRTASPYL